MPLNQKILDVIGCPMCKGKLFYNKDTEELICRFHKVAFPVKDGMPIMLVAKARSITQDGKK